MPLCVRQNCNAGFFMNMLYSCVLTRIYGYAGVLLYITWIVLCM